MKKSGIIGDVIHSWILKYEKYRDCAFDNAPTNAPYTKEYKEKVVLAYLNSEGPYRQLAIRFNTSTQSIIMEWLKGYNSYIELKDYNLRGDVYMTKSRKVNQRERLEIVKYCMARFRP